MKGSTLPREFIWRRLHSLMGLWLVLFLVEHLLVNSQAALLLGNNAQGFVEMVNSIHNLPYLPIIELFLLGVPILIHLVWGVQYLLTGKFNSFPTNGSKPALGGYERNHAYTWQRITSWILIFGIIGHVAKFRFLEYPETLNQGEKSYYFVKLSVDNGLYTVAERLGAKLFDRSAVQEEKKFFDARIQEQALVEAAHSFSEDENYDAQKEMILVSAQRFQQKAEWLAALQRFQITSKEVVAVADNFATASLLVVRDTFKNPVYVFLYTLFVLAACFHGFNGFWTFLITWGVILRIPAQKGMVKFAWGLMLVIAFLGLASVWGTYWLNLRQ